MVDSRRDDAISEVIGFVLIIALIAIIASLYLTYVVPATGRDLEIAHMDVVQNQFLDYKSTVDSLWINGQYNTQVSSPFTLGTNPGSTQGSFVNMPLFQPVTSGGTLAVNTEDTITVTADALYDESPRDPLSSTGNIWYTNVVGKPDHLYVNFSTTDLSTKRSISITPYPAQNGNWEVNLSTLNSTPGRYDVLAITILKNGNPTISNLVINNSIILNQPFIIDLADDAYGLKESFVYPFDLSIVPKSGSGSSQPLGYHKITGSTIIPNTQMGSLEYRSNNNYWISQSYIYQYGGVFLQQDNGGVVKLLPSITVGSVNQNLVSVTINNLTIPGTIPSKVGGSSLVEVLTTLTEPKINPSNLASGVPNAKFVSVTITARDAQTATMWRDTFTKIKQKSNLDNSLIEITQPTGSQTTTMKIYGPSKGSNYDVILDTQSNIANIYLSPTSYS